MILEPKGQFFGRSLHHIAIGTDPDKSITTIHLSFQGPPDSFFYNRLRKAYGENFDVMVRNNVISDETNTQQEGEFIQTLQKKIISLKKGNINDSNIQFVKWEKEAFEIMFIPAAFTIYFKFF